MNAEKIQQKILTALSSYKDNIKLGKTDDNILVIDSGFVCYIIPKTLFVFSDNIFNSLKSVDPKIIEVNEADYKDAELTCELQIIGKFHKGVMVRKIANDTDFAWVDVKLLKMFEPYANFKIKNEVNSVQVYEYGVQVGVVCPTRMNGGNQS